MEETITTLGGARWRFVTCHRCHGDGFRMREYAGDLNKPGARTGMKSFKMGCRKCDGRGYFRFEV